jgi:tRNA(Ile)-lysidine synthase
MIEAVRRFLAAHGIGPSHLLLACSGGIDSTALLLLVGDLRADGFTISAAHVNHHLRGEESDADAAFVRDLCASLEIDLRVVDGTVDPTAIRERGLEAAAREVRHVRLNAVRDDIGAAWVATAHQKNDQAETVLMRMITGTGLGGLRGIHAVREDRWIRPLIDVTREEIEGFLRERSVTPRVDRMNADPRFLRNRVRLLLRDLGSEAIDGLAGVAAQAAELWPVLESTLDAAERGSVVASEQETRFLHLPAEPYLRQALLHRHIRRLGSSREVSAADLRRIAESMDTLTRLTVSRDLELARREQELVLRQIRPATPQFEVTLTAPGSVLIGATGATITIAPSERDTWAGQDKSSQRFQLPEGADPSFLIRNRRAGDRFQPLGMSRDKKLKDFLIDRKIPAESRDTIPLVIWNGEIVWIAGVEVSERFKVTGRSRPVYEVKLEHGASSDGQGHHHLQR